VIRSFAAAAALGCAYAAKAWYADASAEELAFLLGPTAWLVEALTGHGFEAETGMGWLSRERAFLIAPVCAGGNYLVIAFTTLALGFAPRRDAPAAHLGWLLGAAALSYVATLLVNATRIALALALRDAPLPVGPEEAHRVLGVVVYLGALFALVFGAARVFGRGPEVGRAAWLALGLYLAVTLAVPWLRGAHVRPEFWEHARVVLATALALGALLLTGAAAAARARSRASARRPRRPPPSTRA
jgi:exosortase K